MKEIRMTADIIFNAEDFPDALRKLADHFTKRAASVEGSQHDESNLIIKGDIQIINLENGFTMTDSPPSFDEDEDDA